MSGEQQGPPVDLTKGSHPAATAPPSTALPPTGPSVPTVVLGVVLVAVAVLVLATQLWGVELDLDPGLVLPAAVVAAGAVLVVSSVARGLRRSPAARPPR